MYDPLQEVNQVKTKEDLVKFLLNVLRTEDPASWTNQETEDYLEAIAAVLDGLEGRYIMRGEELPEQPTWSMMAEVLASATLYE